CACPARPLAPGPQRASHARKPASSTPSEARRYADRMNRPGLADPGIGSRSARQRPRRGMRSETPVLIVGGGPTGLAASLSLSHLGVPSMLVNKYAGTLEHPKAVALMQRTAELLRLWGAGDEVRRRGVPRVFCKGMVWITTLAREEVGRTEAVGAVDTGPAPQGPATGLRG